MAFDIRDSLVVLQGHIAESGYAHRIQIGEPDQPPSELIMAALYMRSSVVNRLMADGATEETHTCVIRFHMDFKLEPAEEIEFRLAKAASEVSSAIIADFTLGGTVREVDVGGMRGQPLRVDYGHVTIQQMMFRTAEIVISMNVDGSATAAP